MELQVSEMADTRSLFTRAAGHPTVQQFLRFALVGIPATITHYGVMFGLLGLFRLNGVALRANGLELNEIVATSFGFLSGAAVSYVLNRRITFVTKQPVGIGFVKYVLALSVGLVINGAIVGVLHQNVGLHVLLAQLIATGVVLFWNFGASRLLVFRD
jgi:putative flippase GtrA